MQGSAQVASIKETILEVADRREAIFLLPEDAAELLGLLQIRRLKNHILDLPNSTDHRFKLALAACTLPTAVAGQAVPDKLGHDLMTTASRSGIRDPAQLVLSWTVDVKHTLIESSAAH